MNEKWALVPAEKVERAESEVIDYNTLPPYRSPYPSRYKSRYSYDVEFERVVIRFGKSSSKKFRKAVGLIEEFPANMRLDDPHGILISSCRQYFQYKEKIDRLVLLIFSWKTTQIIVNGEPATDRDLRDFLWIFQERLNHYDKKELLPPLNEKVIKNYSDADYDPIE